jgi:hypothetical protein
MKSFHYFATVGGLAADIKCIFALAAKRILMAVLKNGLIISFAAWFDVAINILRLQIGR